MSAPEPIRFASLLVLTLAATSASCGDGKGSISLDMTLQSVSIDTSEIVVSHEILVTAEYAGVTEEVALSLSLIDKADYDHNSAQVNALAPVDMRQYDLTPTLVLEPGSTSVQGRVLIPDDVLPGVYYLGAFLDPHELVDEIDEENNMLVRELGYALDDTWANTPNLVLEQFDFEPDAITVTKDAIGPSSATQHTNHESLGMRLVVSATGGVDLTDVEVGLSEIQISGGEPLLPVAVDPVLMRQLEAAVAALNLPNTFVTHWDDDLQDYAPEFRFDIAAGETKELYLDLQVPFDELTDLLLQVPDALWDQVFAGVPEHLRWLRLQADVTLELDPDQLIVEYEPDGYDNLASSTLTLTIDVRLPQCALENEYKVVFGGSLIGAGLHSTSGVSFDGTGFHGSKEMALPVQLFGAEFEFMGFTSTGDRDPGTQDTLYQLTLQFAGFPVYTKSLDDDSGFAWSKDLPFEKEKESKPKTFFPGGFPITVVASVKGSIGFGVEVSSEVTDDLLVSGGPFANLGVGVIGYPGVPNQDLTIGVGGELTLIEDRIEKTTRVNMIYTPVPICSYTGSVDFEVTNEISTLDGRLFVWIEVPWPKFCKKWGFLPYPCGWTKKKFDHDIVDWDGLTIATQVLMNASCDVTDPVVLTSCP